MRVSISLHSKLQVSPISRLHPELECKEKDEEDREIIEGMSEKQKHHRR